jgi:hypothetical protein
VIAVLPILRFHLKQAIANGCKSIVKPRWQRFMPALILWAGSWRLIPIMIVIRSRSLRLIVNVSMLAGIASAQPGTVAERRIHAAADPRNLTSCRINPAFLPKRCDWTFCSIKVRPIAAATPAARGHFHGVETFCKKILTSRKIRNILSYKV